MGQLNASALFAIADPIRPKPIIPTDLPLNWRKNAMVRAKQTRLQVSHHLSNKETRINSFEETK